MTQIFKDELIGFLCSEVKGQSQGDLTEALFFVSDHQYLPEHLKGILSNFAQITWTLIRCQWSKIKGHGHGGFTMIQDFILQLLCITRYLKE